MDIKERKEPHMKRLITLLLGIVLLLTAVPAMADEETDDCWVLLAIENGEFVDAKHTMYVLNS